MACEKQEERMAQDTTTSMTLTGIFSNLQMSTAASSGLISIGNKAAAKTGYTITAKETEQGKAYSVVAVANEADAVDPATVLITAHYTQEEELSEVDLEAQFKNMPDGTSLQVECSNPTFNIGKQSISGSNLVSSIGMNAGEIDMSIAVSLWITKPKSVTSTSSLTVRLVSITGGGGGPVKKTMLEQVVINLA
jgi:hypothetical protein